MAAPSHRLNLTLDAEHAAKLARLAAQSHLQEGSLARALLSRALDDAEPDARTVAEVLDGIAGAWERAQLGAMQASSGEVVALEDL